MQRWQCGPASWGCCYLRCHRLLPWRVSLLLDRHASNCLRHPAPRRDGPLALVSDRVDQPPHPRRLEPRPERPPREAAAAMGGRDQAVAPAPGPVPGPVGPLGQREAFCPHRAVPCCRPLPAAVASRPRSQEAAGSGSQTTTCQRRPPWRLQPKTRRRSRPVSASSKTTKMHTKSRPCPSLPRRARRRLAAAHQLYAPEALDLGTLALGMLFVAMLAATAFGMRSMNVGARWSSVTHCGALVHGGGNSTYRKVCSGGAGGGGPPQKSGGG